MKNINKKSLLIIISLILIVIFYVGKQNKTDDLIVDFYKYVYQEDYVYATKIYDENKYNKRFVTKSDRFLIELIDHKIENCNEDNLIIVKAFSKFINSIKGEEFASNINSKIDEIEDEILSKELKEKEDKIEVVNADNNQTTVETVLNADNNSITVETVLNTDIVTQRMLKQFNDIYFQGECYSQYVESLNLNELGNLDFNGVDELSGKSIYIMLNGNQINHIIDRDQGSIYEVNSMDWTDSKKIYNFIKLDININDI